MQMMQTEKGTQQRKLQTWQDEQGLLMMKWKVVVPEAENPVIIRSQHTCSTHPTLCSILQHAKLCKVLFAGVC
jgi:hypothetical protein